MQLNPILALELRSRWRSNRSFLLLLGVALTLSLVALFIYQRAIGTTGTSSYDPLTRVTTPALDNFDLRFTAIGRELFSALAHTNILIWLLLAAASAATGIARERERGLLESLQLSRISARSQIAARFEANLLLLGALQLVLLPIYAVSFLMGGVSQWEILQAFALVVASSVVGTALGLWFSARSHRPTGALFGALGVLIVWSGASFYPIRDAVFSSRIFGRTIDWDALWPALLHPNGSFWALTDPTPLWITPLWQTEISVVSIWFVLVALLCWSATRQVGRTLPPPSWQRSARWVEKLKVKQATKPAQSARRQKASGALLADVPLDRLVRFSNPLLSREVKSRFRLRSANLWISIIRGGLFLGAIVGWIFEISWLSDAPSRLQMLPSTLRIFLYGGTLALAVIAATSWTREREGGTWEALKLSLLPPREILRAKWLSPLVSFAYYSAPLWILLPFGAFYVGLDVGLMATIVVIAWLGVSVALGLWMSWRVKNGTASIAWTVGILATLLVAVPYLNELAGVDDTLAQWKYGIGGYQSNYRGYNDDLIERHAAEIKRLGLKQDREVTWFGRNGTTRTFYEYPDGYEFDAWAQRQQNNAREFERNLSVWHPDVALARLFGEGERGDDDYSGRRENAASPQGGDAIAFAVSTLTPLVVTLLLLMLLRRDVRREQLGL